MEARSRAIAIFDNDENQGLYSKRERRSLATDLYINFPTL
jgi:hypothetical protein